MDLDKFWSVMDASRKHGDDSQPQVLSTILMQLPAEDIVKFQEIHIGLRKQAAGGALYGAGSLMNGSPCSDSTFDFFLNWLVARGKAVFSKALADPDSLAELPMVGVCEAWDEDVCYAASEAYEEKTGENMYDQLSYPDDDEEETEPFDWSEHSSAQTLASTYPRLWKIYGARFDENG